MSTNTKPKTAPVTKSAKPQLFANVTFVKTPDGQLHENRTAAETHIAMTELTDLIGNLPVEVTGSVMSNFATVCQLTDAVKATAKKVKHDPTALAAKVWQAVGVKSDTTNVSPASPLPTATPHAESPVGSVGNPTVAATPSEMRKARALVQSFEGRKGKRPNAYHDAVALIAANTKPKAEKASRKAVAPASTPAPTPTARKPRSAKKADAPAGTADAPMTIKQAKDILAAYEGRVGKRPKVFYEAQAMVSAEGCDTQKPAAKKSAPAAQKTSAPAPKQAHIPPTPGQPVADTTEDKPVKKGLPPMPGLPVIGTPAT